MLVLSRAEVESLIDPTALIDAIASAHTELSTGAVSMPPRTAAFVRERDAFLGVMPAFVPSISALMTKLVTLFPRNEPPIPSHQALIAAFDPSDGSPIAIMDGTAITAIRTAAASALATRLLAKEHARILAIVGTGVQARSHAAIVRLVRDFDEIRIAGRTPAHVDRLAAEIGARAFATPEDAVRGADVVCATTHSPTPVILRPWIAEGTHVNSIGYNPGGPEVDVEILRDALVVVEWRETALQDPPAGLHDLAAAVRAGVIGTDHIHADLGELAAGLRPGRTAPEQITLYRSAGLAIQDAAAAALVLRQAAARGVGRRIEL